MKIAKIHSHMNGLEYLGYHKNNLLDEIKDVISQVDAASCRIKESREARKQDQGLLYSPKEMNRLFKLHFNALGWEDERVTNWLCSDLDVLKRSVTLSPEEQKKNIEDRGLTAIRSSNETDFVKNRVAVEVQFGKYSFVAHDLFVKHMAFFSSDRIDVGVEIIPMKSLEKNMSSGVPYFERDYFNLMRQGRGTPAVPLILIGIEP
ncbi:BglII/BstYI family type II restriction endonuclease [Cobetia sp. 14N.309.X.WAT.E.A4]|uniref:BglII/BstYI family type II restriction endonuclease n=1 Tax=Cobetia sp. 14N.309.X.WAT.E.A4 TaxID=2998323 RepID=UPI0025AF6A5A|nr:BglII/BstYI family type II restriction endonuclease [Cobetia sp. 14N.309.X.WAT.E.A4]MDN2657725.1 BglII/BstYI family type II restriction endonuclease [Cobetia sp. 14N.309.X.WAT.E.A4]